MTMPSPTVRALFALLRADLCAGSELCEEDRACLQENFQPLYSLAQKHNIAHLVGHAYGALGLQPPEELAPQLEQLQYIAVYRYEQLNYELGVLCRTLEQAQVPFIPLKGSVIRRYYPEPWMRNSCDIDILVHEEDLPRAIACLTEGLGYRQGQKGSYDVSLFSPGGVHLELHYHLFEETEDGAAEHMLEQAWQYAQPVEGCIYHHAMQDAMFYFYHIAHMAKHFASGGCGIRPFLDLWILEHQVEHDRATRDALLQKGELQVFADSCRALAEVWFSGVEPDDVCIRMESFILTGGVYGTQTNRISVQQNKRGGKFRYALSRIFLPYTLMKHYFPILKKYPWLLPFGHVCRWFKLLFCGGAGRSLRELKTNETLSKELVDSTAVLLEDIGL